MKIKKTQSSLNLREPLWSVVSALVVVALLGVMLPAFAQQGYETAPVLSASKILPPELLSGPNHRVQERVTNDGFMNTYRIDSKFGAMTAVSTALLRKRIGEINAMVVMDKLKGTKEYAAAIKDSALSTLVAAKDLVVQPVKTATEVVSGIGLAFRRAGDSVFGANRSDAEDSKFKSLIGFTTYKRQYAHELGVDVYSRNEILQDRLNEISWAGFAGGLTVSAALAAVPGGAGIAMTVIGTTRVSTEIYKNVPPADLRRMSIDKLKAMGIDALTIETFINDSIFTPREQTELVSALDEMMGVAGRERFVQLAALTHNADMAFFRQRQSEMYAGYHKGVAPLAQFVSVGQLAAARAVNGALAFNIPLDHMVWTEHLGRLVANSDTVASQLPGLTDKQLWVTGTLSPRARAEMGRMNWKVYEKHEALIVTKDKYPAYQK